jgi:hypothetical protein
MRRTIEEATRYALCGSSDNGQLAISAGWPPVLALISNDYSPTATHVALKSGPPPPAHVVASFVP